MISCIWTSSPIGIKKIYLKTSVYLVEVRIKAFGTHTATMKENERVFLTVTKIKLFAKILRSFFAFFFQRAIL